MLSKEARSLRFKFDLDKIFFNIINVKILFLLQAKKFLDPSSIFQSDIDEAKLRVQESIDILLLFRYLFAFIYIL